MLLDRNTSGNMGRGKYGLIKIRRLTELRKENNSDHLPQEVADALRVLADNDVIDYGVGNTNDEFFVIRLRDKFAKVALRAYAIKAENDDMEYAQEVHKLADKSGPDHPACKMPD